MGIFCAIDGCDGSGKSLAVANVAKILAADNISILTTREPGGTPQGNDLRALLLDSGKPAWSRHAQMLLMTAARVEHVEQVLRPALLTHNVVISDRFVSTTLAFQGAGLGIDENFIVDVHNGATGHFWPDLTIIIDVSAEIALQRAIARNTAAIGPDESRYENLGLSFQDRARQGYRKQVENSAKFPKRGKYMLVNGNQTPDLVAKRIAYLIVTEIIRNRSDQKTICRGAHT